MQYTASIVLFSTLIAKLCFANLTIKTPEEHESLVEASIEILESCYADRFDIVAIAGPSAGSVIKSISSRKTVISTTLIGMDWMPEQPLRARHKLHVFVVTLAGSDAPIGDITRVALGAIKISKWFNAIASFLIIDSAEKKNGCTNAYEVLSKAWEAKLLNAKFICFHQTRGKLIYTFNPCTIKAPIPWRQVNIYKVNFYKSVKGHNWTLFERNYDSDDSRCNGMDFDKTVDLGGYPIIVRYDKFGTTWKRGDWYRPVMVQWLNVTNRLLMESMNALWEVDDPGARYAKPDVRYWLSLRRYDMKFPVVIVTYENDYTYPIIQKERYIMTQYRGHKSPLDKFISVLDKSSRFGVLAVLAITLLFFKFWMRKPLIDAILNLVRLICNTGLQGIPRQTAPRIYLTSLFILVVTIQGIYSGILASMLTKNVRLPTVDSLEDVIRDNMTLHITGEGYIDRVYVVNKDSDLVFLEYSSRTTYLFNAEEAKLGYWLDFIDVAVREEYHLSREAVEYDYAGYYVTSDWPLVERVNTIFGRLAASGIPNLLHAKIFQSQIRILKSYELEEHEPELKPLSLEHLGFAFKILAIGLGLATMVFIYEVATKDWD